MDLTDHRRATFLENVDFLKETGLSMEQIAKRLGVSQDLLEKKIQRGINGTD